MSSFSFLSQKAAEKNCQIFKICKSSLKKVFIFSSNLLIFWFFRVIWFRFILFLFTKSIFLFLICFNKIFFSSRQFKSNTWSLSKTVGGMGRRRGREYNRKERVSVVVVANKYLGDRFSVPRRVSSSPQNSLSQAYKTTLLDNTHTGRRTPR